MKQATSSWATSLRTSQWPWRRAIRKKNYAAILSATKDLLSLSISTKRGGPHPFAQSAKGWEPQSSTNRFRSLGRFHHTIPIRHCRKRPKPLRKFRYQHALRTTPAPVITRSRGNIHASLRAKLQNVLHGEQADIRHRSSSSSNQRPYNAVRAWLDIRFHRGFFNLGRAILPPTARRIVIVRPGVNNAVLFIAMRQIIVRSTVREAKLKNPHPRQIELFAQRVYFRSNQPKILCDKRKLAQRFV